MFLYPSTTSLTFNSVILSTSKKDNGVVRFLEFALHLSLLN